MGRPRCVRTPDVSKRRAAPQRIVRLELALQGGGAHGAFTWGVLDRLLDEPRLRIVAISGASAGAINAVLVAHGLGRGGAAAAQCALWQFWKGVARSASAMRAAGAAFDLLAPPAALSSGAFAPFALWAATHAAWQAFTERAMRSVGALPQDLNPLGALLERTVDFESLRRPDAVQLFLSATEVATGELRVFRNADLSPAAVLASACLPQLFRAVEIDGRAYWDGGYLANPPLAPLIAESEADDLLIVQLNPPRRTDLPAGPEAIADRINEITFNASLVNELRGIAALKRALSALPVKGQLREPLLDRLFGLRLHRIAADEGDYSPGARGKFNPEWSYLQRLHRRGRETAGTWLSHHGGTLGRDGTFCGDEHDRVKG